MPVALHFLPPSFPLLIKQTNNGSINQSIKEEKDEATVAPPCVYANDPRTAAIKGKLRSE